MSHAAESTPCRLLVDPPASGAWNMAVDEMLLEWCEAHRGCCWRFYRWEEPTLSLGYFQLLEDRRRHAASRDCPVVRRASGGGAVLHDGELTYSFVAPSGHRLARRRGFLYEAIHSALVEVLSELGIKASLFEQPPQQPVREQPFLCFLRRTQGDVLVGKTKIAGSAQRRRRGAVLQHGSVLLGRTQAAPELDALENLAQRPLRHEQLVDDWLDQLARRLALAWRTEPLSDEQRRRAAALAKNKYGSQRWTTNHRP